MRNACLLLCTVISVYTRLWGQADAHQQLRESLHLAQQGEFNRVIDEIPKLLNSNSLDQAEVGQAWTALGFAYRGRGNLMLAQSAYEHALQVLSRDSKYAEAYAIALDNFADLYRDMEQMQDAEEVEKKAIEIYEQLNRHASLASCYSNLAGLELSQNRRHKIPDYLSRALQEAALAGTMDEDFFASVAEKQGWLDEGRGDKKEAIYNYERALYLWRHQHGEEHMYTGWGYMILGKAYAHAGQYDTGLADMRKGLDIIDRTMGKDNPKYLAGEIAYSRILDQVGQHREAVRIKKEAQHELETLFRNQCVDCRISASALY